MKAVAVMKKPRMNVALVESDPLRLVGFRSLFDSQSEIEVSPVTLAEIAYRDNIDVALLGSRNDGRNLFDMIAGLKAAGRAFAFW